MKRQNSISQKSSIAEISDTTSDAGEGLFSKLLKMKGIDNKSEQKQGKFNVNFKD